VINKFQVGKVVNIYLVCENNYHFISTQLDCFHLAAETQFADASVLVVIPAYEWVPVRKHQLETRNGDNNNNDFSMKILHNIVLSFLHEIYHLRGKVLE
jgi:hypothetical protein